MLHGGQGTVQTACATGIPFVGMGLQPEQTWHVRMCEQRGNAIAVAPRRVGSPEFLDAVRRVLSDPGIRAVAQTTSSAPTPTRTEPPPARGSSRPRSDRKTVTDAATSGARHPLCYPCHAPKGCTGM